MNAVLWSTRQESMAKTWSTSDVFVDVHYYPQTGKYCVCNNSYDERESKVYTDADSFEVMLKGGEIRWYEMPIRKKVL
jgi:1,3-beta-galactosyl-N-acetylhexosamine phosphorylase